MIADVSIDDIGGADATGMKTTGDTDTRDLARGASVNYLGFVARLGARAPFLFLAAVLYGEALFGQYTFGITVIETAAGLAVFGMKRSLLKFMSEAAARGEGLHRPIANAIALGLATATAATVAVALGAGLLATAFRFPSATDTLRLLAPAIPMIVASDILLAALGFTRRMGYDVWARSVAEPVTLTATAVAAYSLGARDTGLPIAYVASLTVAAGISAIFFARIYPLGACVKSTLRWDELRELVAFSGPTAGYDFMNALADRADIFIISYFSPAGVVGVYGMARQLATVSKKIRYGFDRILPPIFAQALASGNMRRAETHLATASRWILSAQLLIVLVFVFYSADILGLLGGQFAGGATTLVLLLVAEAISGTFGVSELPIIFLRPSVNALLGAVTVVLTLAVGIGLGSRMGPEGMALALVITYSVVNALRVATNWRLFGITGLNGGVFKPFLAGLLAAGVVLLLGLVPYPGPIVHSVLAPALLVATYVAVLFLVCLQPEDRQLLRRLRRAG